MTNTLDQAAASTNGGCRPIPLWIKHRPLARKLARDWRLPGYERQDIEQEALIGLWSASVDWRPDGGAAFTTFARLVIERRLATCLKLACRRKHTFLNESVRVDANDDEAVAALPCLHQITDHADDRELLGNVIAALPSLSELERHAVLGIAAGYAYDELGDPRAIDNAAQRARRKLRAAA